MSLDARLDRLMPALSGRERAIRVLRNFKEGRTQDKRLQQGMSNAEATEYNRLIGLMDVCNQNLVALITLLVQLVDKLELAVYRDSLTLGEPSDADVQEMWNLVQRCSRS